MPRDIPQGKKMPSLSVAIIGDKGKGPTPPAGLGKTDPAPDAGPSDSNESTFTCPECGASLKCESAGESAMEHGEEGAEATGGMGA